MFHRDIQTSRRELKIRVFFDEIRGVSMTDETRSRVFDKSSQSKQKRKSKRKSKLKSSKSMLIKTGYPNLLHACDLLCFNVINY